MASDFNKRMEEMMKKMVHIRKEFGPAKMPAVEIFESAPCYEEEKVVALTKLCNRIQSCSDDERPALIEEFRALLATVERKPDAPRCIELWPEGKIPTETEYTENTDYRYHHNPDFRPYLVEMLVPQEVTPKGAIVLCPGGDHAEACVCEGYQSAKEFNALGYQCFLLMNRPNHNPWNAHEVGADAARAIRYVRAHAAEYRVDPGFIAFAGFSNGGLTGEALIENYSGNKKVSDYFPDYVPDELDEYKGAMDAFICVYGPRFVGADFNWEGVEYPPVFYAVGREDTALRNFNYVYPDLLRHNVPAEVHTFAGVPHGKAGTILIDDDYPNFDLWVPLADAFLQDLKKKRG